MKFLLMLLLLALAVFLIGFKRGRDGTPGAGQAGSTGTNKPAQDPTPQAMLRCTECGLHLPAAEALPGRGGQFCSAAHRAAYEARGGERS
ncbi:PP0621 family protein [Paucibacter sp. APW11]|uniref:PP0621 family protein n=1 Tax=Roseateles aquae TaxID=3077235 RepID=A0ABU3PEZ6_9BURK|nr:PP0621 family protein [Paucibacter sp. APW11]MDT9001150.1 PP0621 family protein [Paucibacter sp. APW11]